MNNCEILYKGEIGEIRRALKRYLKDANEEVLFQKFIKGSFPKQTRFTKTNLDESDDIQRSIKQFSNDLDSVIEALILNSPQSESSLRKVQQSIQERLHIDLDESQSGSIQESSDSIEAKTVTELRDLNTSNLLEHFKEIYGAGSYRILRDLKESFGDDTTAAGYWNVNTGQTVTRNDQSLNKNFQELKNKYFKQIVGYLREIYPSESFKDSMIENDKFIGSEYFKTLSKFYNYIKTLPDFQQKLEVKETIDKSPIYHTLMEQLRQIPNFNNEVKFNGEQLQEMMTQLYTNGHFSQYYIEAKRIIQKLNLGDQFKDLVDQIEAPTVNILEATNAYTKLVHFDELLVDSHGSSFEIQNGLMGIEYGDMNKYKYKQDTAHQKKSWQQSESIESEKYTANLTKQILNQIRIEDYRTNSYKGKRVDPTSFIMASRNLLDATSKGDISWRNIPNQGPLREQFDNFILSVIQLHENPSIKYQNILEYLFGETQGYRNIAYKKKLSDTDLDILYSTYKYVYDKSNPYSLVNQESKNIKSINGPVQNLVSEISSFVDRNVTMAYTETSYRDGKVEVKVKKRFNNSLKVIKHIRKINLNNNVTVNKANELVQKWNFSTSDLVDGYSIYSIKVADENITLKVPGTGSRILSNSNRISYSNNPAFSRIENIDLTDFKNKVLTDSILTEDEQLLKEMLQFIDDHLGLNILGNTSLGLDTLASYKTLYTPIVDKVVGDNFLMPLMQLAIRSAYVNYQYAQANGTPMGTYLNSISDPIYNSYKSSKDKSKVFSEKYNNVKYTIASYLDEVLGQWSDAQSILDGANLRATTKDKSGNSIPNNSVNKLGTNLEYYLDKQQDSNVSSLFFVQNPNLITSVFHDLEVTSWNDQTKQIKDLTAGELFFHSIFNKFWGSYLSNGTIIVQPTTYSDKTTFINYGISSMFNDEDILQDDNYRQKILDLTVGTIGTYYRNVWSNTQNKLQQVANIYNTINGTQLSYKQVMGLLSEEQLVDLAYRNGITLSKDTDYRVISDKTAPNELLQYYADYLYLKPNNLEQFLEEQKIQFVRNLVNNYVSFQVVNFGDNYNDYIEEQKIESPKSKNPVMNTILQVYNTIESRVEFFKNWVDPSTGRLILAKQNGINILQGEIKGSIELNPLLDKFFYIESFVSNNLRMSLTGSEINHPDKAKKTLFNKVKNNTNFVDFQKQGLHDVTSNNIEEVIQALSEARYVGDIPDIILKHPKVANILRTIYDRSILTISNVAQGTQFKRNVIITATLQYCTQKTKDGISPKIKCAVIMDEPAPVYNYRGDHDKPIDSADGSAQINPFQSILENKSLGSQAVGFIKKPIWHDYDTDEGTAFLAKFATDTITNESMRASLGSKTSLYKLFRKMTDLPWQGDVSLTESLTLGELGNNPIKLGTLNKWFNTVILGNSVVNGEIQKVNRLIYKNAYGDKIEIGGFDQENGIYFTRETVFTKIGNTQYKKVYHVFDSNHHKFDTYEQAQQFINKTGGHTINSLFELHSALGGINCVDSNGNYSEFSNEVVVNFMNNVGRIKEGYSSDSFIDQDSYNQPLKKYHIGYALNNSAVKNGAKNINQYNVWNDDTPLRYFEVNSDGLGMQMNADHDIVDSELTEFSQVITATSAYGYTHDQTDEIFQALASAALAASKKTLDSVDNFLKENIDSENYSKARSDLYDSIGRILQVGTSIKDKESLQGIIFEAVNRVFNKNKNHSQDSYKIPFSDPNIYSDFIATLASTINKESIKRKHTGSGCVIVPAYNMMQYYELNGKKMMFTDLVNKAQKDYNEELQELLKTSLNYNGEVVLVDGEEIGLRNQPTYYLEQLLNKLGMENRSRYYIDSTDDSFKIHYQVTKYLEKQQEMAPIMDSSWFMPSDIVDIISENGNVKTVDLDTLDKYYKFTDGLYNIEADYQVIIDNSKPNKFTIKLEEDTSQAFVIEKEVDSDKWNIHFKTGGKNESLQRRTPWNGTEKQKIRLFNAALQALPDGAILRLSPSTREQIDSGIGGLTSGSIAGYQSIINNEQRRSGVQLETVSDPYKVSYFDINGILHTTQVSEYRKLSNIPKEYKYRVNVTRPHNLRPSLIRWQYQDGDSIKYMNIFDSPVIRNSFFGKRNDNYRTEIQKVLHDLDDGVFVDKNGVSRQVLAGTLENSAAELIMSNLYKDKFGIENESLSDILEQGVNYFRKKYKKLNSPENLNYDIAFLKDSGQHTLIAINPVKPNNYITESSFNPSQLSVNEKDEIILMKGGRELFEVGKWVNFDGTYKDGIFKDKNGVILDNQEEYRLKDVDNPMSVQKRINYVTRYNIVNKMVNSKKVIYKTDTLYELAPLSKFEEALGNQKDANKQRASILAKIYLQQDYKIAQINPNKVFSSLDNIRSSLSFFKTNVYIPQNIKDLIFTQLGSIETTDLKPLEDKELDKIRVAQLKDTQKKNKEKYKQLIEEFLDREAAKKWASFQDSLNYIAARIPAQTLQSFMTMKQIAWTENSKNMAYVSHFQTYLQGSDYDIDKAYIMGQSYDANGVYVGWSNLFDSSTIETLSASKKLPAPKRIEMSLSEDGVILDQEINELFSTENKVRRIELYSQIIKKAEKASGKINYKGENGQQLIDTLNRHEFYPISTNVEAFKNVASSNIYNISHDIRNRDQAYTAISMDIMQKAASDSPKGEEAFKLNMLNPLTKYVMQYQNLVGKNVISIAANGEKVWFNAYYYWHQILKSEDPNKIKRLKFQQTFNRIHGRAKKNLSQKTSTHLPDLNIFDQQIRNILLSEFQATPGTLEYRYVDQVISQLLSAATDNAKELILAKINAGTNFARMYVYGIMMGFDLDDLVQFMISPVSEFIDGMSNQNIFQEDSSNNYAKSAIDLASGKINVNNFIHGTISYFMDDPETGERIRKNGSKYLYLLNQFNDLPEELLNNLLLRENEKRFKQLDKAAQRLINYIVYSGQNININELIESDDAEINSFLSYCQNIADRLKNVRKRYKNIQEFQGDIQEFKKLYELASEISTISSAWLGLNQGLPTSELDILKRLSDMSKIVSSREQALGIYNSEDLLENPDKLGQIILSIQENNPTLTEQEIIGGITKHKDLIGNFNIVEYLKSSEYRQNIIEYYDLIKGTLNVFDMMEVIPHYKQIIECFKSLVVSNNTLASKSRLLQKIIKDSKKDTLDDSQLRKIISYVDNLNIYNFFQNSDLPIIKVKGGLVEGFNLYFQNIETSKIDFSTLEGIATLKHWVENEFLSWLREEYNDINSRLYKNKAIPHLTLVANSFGVSLATDIDLVNPDQTLSSRDAYDDILKGFSEFEKVNYDTDYTIADILQLYNLAVNKNQYGEERLTTVFKVCTSPKNIINKYFKFISTQDYLDSDLEYDYYDCLINMAPIISEYKERFTTDLFVRTIDPVQGYILKKKDKGNSYVSWDILPEYKNKETQEEKLRRLENFQENLPIQMPNSHKKMIISQAIDFDEKTDRVKENIFNILKSYSLSNKLKIFEECYGV